MADPKPTASRSFGSSGVASSTSASASGVGSASASDAWRAAQLLTSTAARDASSAAAPDASFAATLEARLKAVQDAATAKEAELQALNAEVRAAAARLDDARLVVDTGSEWSFTSDDCPRPKRPRDPRLASPRSQDTASTKPAPTLRYFPDARDGSKPPHVGVDFDWVRPGGYQWQARMKAERALMAVKAARGGVPLFPTKPFADRPRSVRYLPSASAKASRTMHACGCFPPARRLLAPESLRATGPLDALRTQLLYRSYRTYADYLHGRASEPPVPLP